MSGTCRRKHHRPTPAQRMAAEERARASIDARSGRPLTDQEWSEAKANLKIGLRGRRGKTIARSNIAILLANPVYTGTFRWGGKTYEGKYEPLITRALFEEVQDILAGRTRPCKRKYTFTYTGMITCKTCNGLLVGDRKKGKYTYYACNKCRTYYPEAFFDQHTARTLERIAIDENMTDFLLHQLGDWFDEATRTESTSTE
ncbi:MAG TPA: recombinase family protein [Thermoanaerobaculia bacterium]